MSPVVKLEAFITPPRVTIYCYSMEQVREVQEWLIENAPRHWRVETLAAKMVEIEELAVLD